MALSFKEEAETIDDNEYKVDGDGTDDDEATLDEQEANEKNLSHAEEMDELEAEGKLSVEELYNKYAAAYDSDFEMPKSEKQLDSDDDESDEDEDGSTSGEGNRSFVFFLEFRNRCLIWLKFPSSFVFWAGSRSDDHMMGERKIPF